VDIEQFRHEAEQSCFVEYRAGSARHRVVLYSRGKWEIIGRIDMIFKHAEVPGWHGEPVVETSLTAASDMDESAIADVNARPVSVKPSEQQVLNQASRL